MLSLLCYTTFVLKGDQALEEVTTRLVRDFKPQAIILFGSYAWGKPNEHSDLDFLVIKDGQESSHQLNVQALKFLMDIDYPLDLLVYKPEEIKQKKNLFFKKIISDGKLLYGRL